MGGLSALRLIKANYFDELWRLYFSAIWRLKRRRWPAAVIDPSLLWEERRREEKRMELLTQLVASEELSRFERRAFVYVYISMCVCVRTAQLIWHDLWMSLWPSAANNSHSQHNELRWMRKRDRERVRRERDKSMSKGVNGSSIQRSAHETQEEAITIE